MKGEACRCDGERRWRWRIYRVLMFLAGLSLLGYIPYKMLTQPQAMVGLYGVLFPSASVLAVAGMVFAARPALALRLPLALALPIGLLAGGWLTTGLECIPTLTRAILNEPFGGLFATFHMALQHVMLSVSLAALVLRPHATFALFGVREPEEPAAVELARTSA